MRAGYAFRAFKDGQPITGVQVEVRRKSQGMPLPQLYAEREGGAALGNPFTWSSDAPIVFYLDIGGAYTIQVSKVIGGNIWSEFWPHVAIGTNAESDFNTAFEPSGAWDGEARYAKGGMVSMASGERVYAFVSRVDDNENNEPQFTEGMPDLSDPYWQAIGLIESPGAPGEGLNFDHGPVADLTERDAFVGIAVDELIAVSDIGNGRSAVYKLLNDSPQTWSDPLYVSGVQGPEGDGATVTVGMVGTAAPGDPASVVNVGTETDAVLNFEIPQGDQGEPGQDFSPDEVVATFADREDYDDEAKGFAVLVEADESKDGGSYIYFKLSASSADWSSGSAFGASPGGGGDLPDPSGHDNEMLAAKSDGSGVEFRKLPATSVYANATGSEAAGGAVQGTVDHRVFARSGGVLQFTQIIWSMIGSSIIASAGNVREKYASAFVSPANLYAALAPQALSISAGNVAVNLHTMGRKGTLNFNANATLQLPTNCAIGDDYEIEVTANTGTPTWAWASGHIGPDYTDESLPAVSNVNTKRTRFLCTVKAVSGSTATSVQVLPVAAEE